MTAPALWRVEEAGLNALQTQRQLFYDGWLLRVSPGSARRARSVNAHFGSTLPLDAKIDYCEGLYAARGLPTLFRITPFVHPANLVDVLGARGYVAFDPTLVQVADLTRPPAISIDPDIELSTPPVSEFVDAVADLRASTPTQRAAHRERLGSTPLTVRSVLATRKGQVIGCGQVALEHGLAGIYDMITAPAERGRGVATQIVTELLTWAWNHGAAHTYLQVDAANLPALACYRKFGFATAYTYYYCARRDECQ